MQGLHYVQYMHQGIALCTGEWFARDSALWDDLAFDLTLWIWLHEIRRYGIGSCIWANEKRVYTNVHSFCLRFRQSHSASMFSTMPSSPSWFVTKRAFRPQRRRHFFIRNGHHLHPAFLTYSSSITKLLIFPPTLFHSFIVSIPKKQNVVFFKLNSTSYLVLWHTRF